MRRQCSKRQFWIRWILPGLMLFPAARCPGQATIGLIRAEPGACPGFTLFAPANSTHTYLVDIDGYLRHRWTSPYRTGHAAYLLPNGHLLRAANNLGLFFRGGGAGGRIEEYDWEGRLIWAFDYSNADHRQHHDAIKLPNGNVLMIAWQRKSYEEAVAAGRDPARLTDGELWSDSLIEVKPIGAYGGEIVWEWHAWDHLIQDFDATKTNYGVVADHPGKIDINYARNGDSDWLHLNGVDYHPGRDQVVLSSPFLNEIWVIDHSTSTSEAASSTGGSRGRGGDLLYRWGNPAAYRAGTEADQTLFGQHNPQWIKDGLPGAGHILVFNNGVGRPDGAYSSVDEIIPPVDEDGDYQLGDTGVYGPDAVTWSFGDDPPGSFHAPIVSGAQRLPNGNTLICDGPSGSFFEVTSDHTEVWRYVNPVTGLGPVVQGQQAFGNMVFRATRYTANHPGLVGRDLISLGTVELPVDQTLRLVEIRDEKPSALLRWTSLPETTYEIQYLPDLNDRVWEPIGEVRAVGTRAQFRDTKSTVGAGFYRILAGQPGF